MNANYDYYIFTFLPLSPCISPYKLSHYVSHFLKMTNQVNLLEAQLFNEANRSVHATLQFASTGPMLALQHHITFNPSIYRLFIGQEGCMTVRAAYRWAVGFALLLSI